MKKETQGLLSIHFAVLLFGLSGLFGKFISLSPFFIVLGRTFFASLTLGLVLVLRRQSSRVQSRKDIIAFLLMGGVLAFHWGCFFYAIQVSSVAIGLLAFSTFPVFVTFMEPFFFNERLRLFDIWTALFVFCGLILVIPSFDFGHRITQGAAWGTLAGFTFAVLSLLNRGYVRTYPSTVIAFYQNSVAALILLPVFGMESSLMGTRDLFLLTILGILCTAGAHTLFIKGLVHVRAQLASLTASLEPVYGIVFALLLLKEVPAPRTALGGLIILGTTVAAALRPKTDI